MGHWFDIFNHIQESHRSVSTYNSLISVELHVLWSAGRFKFINACGFCVIDGVALPGFSWSLISMMTC